MISTNIFYDAINLLVSSISSLFANIYTFFDFFNYVPFDKGFLAGFTVLDLLFGFGLYLILSAVIIRFALSIIKFI